MYVSCEDNPGYDPMDPRDEPEPDEYEQSAIRPISTAQVLKLLEDIESIECPPGCRCKYCEIRD